MHLNSKEQTLTVNEYELHDIIADAREGLVRHQPECPDDIKTGRELFAEVKIVPKEPDEFSQVLAYKWERKINFLLSLLGEYDADYHDDAEQTC